MHFYATKIEISSINFIIPCLAITCADPGTPQHGSRSGSETFKYGSKVSYRCNKGYIIFGSYERSCRDEGEWTGVQPYCVGKYVLYTAFMKIELLNRFANTYLE